MSAFRWGAIAGFALPVLVVVLLKAWIGPQLYSPKFNVEVVSSGADVTRHGGAKVVVSDSHGTVAEQVCRQTCDDFKLQISSPDNAFGVSVLDPGGVSLVSGAGAYVTAGYGTPVTRWTISGRDALDAQLSVIDRQPDGTFEETPFHPASSQDGASPGAGAPVP